VAAIEAIDLHKSFGQLAALSGASLTVQEGEFHGLIGPNGSGKSTFMKCLAAAETPDRGRLFLNGMDIGKLGRAARARAGMSIKFQITSVLPTLTIFDNVLLAAQSSETFVTLLRSQSSRALQDKVMITLDQFRLAHRAHERASVLSHGEQQWLEIAMALSTDPKLLLLDEPTAGMSIEERRMTGDLLRALKDRCSIIIVEHDLDFVRDLCDRLTVLDQGRVLHCGTVAEMQASAEVQKVYLRRV